MIRCRTVDRRCDAESNPDSGGKTYFDAHGVQGHRSALFERHIYTPGTETLYRYTDGRRAAKSKYNGKIEDPT
jgi:hypothetical protein